MISNNSNFNNLVKRAKRRRMITGILFLIIIGAIVYFGMRTASFERWTKSIKSEYSGGLNRIVTVYDNNGHEIRKWSGKTDIEENTYGNKVLFEMDGKRKVVYNAVVIVEEE